jgi:predicted phage-related endonuclease
LKVQRLEAKLQNLYQSEKALKKIIKRERRLKEDIHRQEQAKAEMLQRASMQLLQKDHNLSEQISILIQDNKAITSELRQLKHLPSVEPSPIDAVADKTDTMAIDKVVRLLKMKYRSVALKHKAEKDAAVSAFHLMLPLNYKIL